MFPILSKNNEQELFLQYKNYDNINAAHQLVLSHLRLVVSVSRNYLGYGISHSDLIQEGNIGLMKAVKRFNPSKGVRLVTFALFWIKAEINDFILKNWKIVKVATTKAQKKLFYKLKSFVNSFNSLSSDEISNIAANLDVKVSDVKDMEIKLNCKDIALGVQDSEIEESNFLVDSESNPYKKIEKSEISRKSVKLLMDAISTLDDRSQKIIKSRWLFDSRKVKLLELSKKFGISQERVRQIELKAISHLKEILGTSSLFIKDN